MTSKLVMDRLQAAGLSDVLTARQRGERPDAELEARIRCADLLVLGAAADVARRRELGDEAAIFVPRAPPEAALLMALRPDRGEGGTVFLRRVATLRLTGAIGLSIVIDWTYLGLETAQLALSFGASGLSGPVAARRGLPMAELDEPRGLVKRREISAYVERAGYRPRFVNTSASADPDVVLNEGSMSARGNAHVGS